MAQAVTDQEVFTDDDVAKMSAPVNSSQDVFTDDEVAQLSQPQKPEGVRGGEGFI